MENITGVWNWQDFVPQAMQTLVVKRGENWDAHLVSGRAELILNVQAKILCLESVESMTPACSDEDLLPAKEYYWNASGLLQLIYSRLIDASGRDVPPSMVGYIGALSAVADYEAITFHSRWCGLTL